jgi:DNA adenine methylase
MDSQPISRYAGGKRKLLPEILARMPVGFGPDDKLVELYAGGAALFWNLTSPTRPQRAVLVEASPYIRNLYEWIQADPSRVFQQLQRFSRLEESRLTLADTYSTVRSELNEVEERNTDLTAAQTLYLLCRCFNGLWRVNASGEMNTPVGKWKYEPPRLPTEADLALFSAALRKAEIMANFYEAGEGDVIFADPPYWGGFTAYTAGGFSWTDQVSCAAGLRVFAEQGATIIATNSDTPEIRDLYERYGFEVEETSRSGNINSKATARQRVGEVIITHDRANVHSTWDRLS